MQNRYFVGIDGGASKTSGIVMDEQGRYLADFTGSPCALHGLPSSENISALCEILHNLISTSGISLNDIAAIGVGLNGIDLPEETPTQIEMIANAFNYPAQQLILENDGIVALWGGSPNGDAAVIQHGSGVTSAYRSELGQEKPFDHLNIGKVFDVRIQMIALVARMIDGREQSTPLRDAVLRHLNVPENDYHEKVFKAKRSTPIIRNLLGVLESAWNEKDSAAVKLINTAVQDYLQLGLAMLQRIPSTAPDLILGGGVLSRFPKQALTLLADQIRKSIPEARVAFPLFSPAIGAAVMAAHQADVDTSSLYQKIQNQNNHKVECW